MHYQLRLFDAIGRDSGEIIVEAVDDEAALSSARQQVHTGSVEVWRGQTRIDRVEITHTAVVKRTPD